MSPYYRWNPRRNPVQLEWQEYEVIASEVVPFPVGVRLAYQVQEADLEPGQTHTYWSDHYGQTLVVPVGDYVEWIPEGDILLYHPAEQWEAEHRVAGTGVTT